MRCEGGRWEPTSAFSKSGAARAVYGVASFTIGLWQCRYKENGLS
jgi:hypothetical protein